MLDVKAGQTYVCTKSDRPWWTKGKEYKVVVTSNGKPCFIDDDDDGTKWTIEYLTKHGGQFKLKETSSFKKYGKLMFSMDELSAEKEKSLDLNKLTVYQLKEYVDLQQALELAENEVQVKLAKKELAQHKLKELIERMSK